MDYLWKDKCLREKRGKDISVFVFNKYNLFFVGKECSIPQRVNRYNVSDRLPSCMMHSEKRSNQTRMAACKQPWKGRDSRQVGSFSQSARVITSFMPPHGGPARNSRRRSRTAAFSSLGSPWHFVVVRKKIIARARARVLSDPCSRQ